MRKHLLLILVLLMICAVSNVVAADNYGTAGAPNNEPDSSSMQIKAYRIFEDEKPYCNVVITSSLVSGLDRVENNESITINDSYVEQFMGITGGDENDYHMTSFPEHVIFSYRIEGNRKGKFTLKLDFEPFYLVGVELPAKNQCIASAFEIGHETYHFNSTGNGSGANGEEIKYESGKPSESGDDRERILLNLGEKKSFTRTWSVSDNTENGITSDWAARGAIALDIGPTTFDAADYGTYRSAVTVTLTTSS